MGTATLERLAVNRLLRFASKCLATTTLWSGVVCRCVGEEPRSSPSPEPAPIAAPRIIVAVGAAGEATYGESFQAWAEQWRATAEEAGASFAAVGMATEKPHGESSNDLERLRELIAAEQDTAADAPPLWIILIAHGTYAEQIAKFNLVGPDLSASMLGDWLQSLRRPLVLINTASASGPFMQTLAAENRIVVTATRSGAEQNFARFGKFLAAAIGDFAADLDHDDAVSILEAYLMASAQTERFYKSEGRLATEHALLDDNGDGVGTPPEFFLGTRVIKRSQDGQPVDGAVARYVVLASGAEFSLTETERQQRDRLEQQLEAVRDRKQTLSEEAYYEQLDAIFGELASIYDVAAESTKPAEAAEDGKPKESKEPEEPDLKVENAEAAAERTAAE